MKWRNRRLEAKREQRVNRLVQKFGLLDRRGEITGVWGWKARRRKVHAMAHA